jgi:pentatricopeptide repeat protein
MGRDGYLKVARQVLQRMQQEGLVYDDDVPAFDQRSPSTRTRNTDHPVRTER